MIISFCLIIGYNIHTALVIQIKTLLKNDIDDRGLQPHQSYDGNTANSKQSQQGSRRRNKKSACNGIR